MGSGGGGLQCRGAAAQMCGIVAECCCVMPMGNASGRRASIHGHGTEGARRGHLSTLSEPSPACWPCCAPVEGAGCVLSARTHAHTQTHRHTCVSTTAVWLVLDCRGSCRVHAPLHPGTHACSPHPLARGAESADGGGGDRRCDCHGLHRRPCTRWVGGGGESCVCVCVHGRGTLLVR